MRAAIYARVSTEKQEQEQTVQSQLSGLRQRVEEDGLGAAGEYLDEGYSRDTLVRPELDRLRDAAAAGDLNRVYIHSPDRLASGAGLIVVRDELIKAGTEVVFLKGDVEDTPEGKLLMHMQGAIAEYEKTKIAERTRRGKLHWASEGFLVNYRKPYGYHFVARSDSMRAHLEIDEVQATAVRLMFSMLVEEIQSTRAIAMRLTEDGVPTARGARQWQPTAVGKILKNPIYTGLVRYNVTESVVPAGAGGRDRYRREVKTTTRPRPEKEWIERHDGGLAIVDADTWAAAQSKLAENSRYGRRNNNRYQYLLRGLIRCSKCDGAFTGAANHGKRRYRCTAVDPTISSTGRRCSVHSVLADPLEDAVWEAVTDALQDKELLRSEFESRLTDTALADDADRRLKHIDVALKHVERQLDRVTDAYENDAMDLDMYKQRGDRLRDRIAALNDEAKALREQQITEQEIARSTESFEDFLKQIDAGLKALTFEERQQFLRLLVEKITYEDGKAKVEVVLPPSSDDESAYLSRKDPEALEG